MKKLLVSGLALVLLTGGAFAQALPQPQPPPAAGAAAPPPPPPEGLAATRPPAPPAPGLAPLPPPGEAESGPGDMGEELPPGGTGPQSHRPPPPPSKAAHFRLQRGGAIVDVKCADDEQMKVCADLTLQMVDRLQTMLKP
jgi:hypothetical protein